MAQRHGDHLADRLHRLGDEPGLWPHVREQLRFLGPEDFLAVWFWLVWRETLGAAALPRRSRARERLDALWRLAETRLGRLPAVERQHPGAVPADLVAWLLGSYHETWGGLDHFEGWLRSCAPPGVWIGRLSLLIPFVPGWKPATRRAVLALTIRLLDPPPEPEAHLEQLGDLAATARALDCGTQAELLLDEMHVLLGLQDESQRLWLIFALAMQWLANGQARHARFALKAWQAALAESEPDEQRWEVERVLSDFVWHWRSTRVAGLTLESHSLFHAWLLRVADWVQRRCPADYRPDMLLKLLRIGLLWQLPEADRWRQTLGLASAPPLQLALTVALASARLPYPDEFEPFAEASAFARTLPAWLRRLGHAAAVPLLETSFYLPDGLEWKQRARWLQLKIATVLLAHSPGRRLASRRRRLAEWGMELLAPLRADAIAARRKALLRLLRRSQRLVTGGDAQSLSETIAAAGDLARELQDESDFAEAAGSELQDWIKAVLALPADEIEPDWLLALDELVEACPPGSARWKLRLALVEAGTNQPGHEALTGHWQRLFEDWAGLDDYLDRLSGIVSLGRALAKSALPGREAWFERLRGLALQVGPEYRDSALVAVGHCRILAGDLIAGLAELRRLDAPAERMRALIQVGTLLDEIGDRGFHPELFDSLWACAAAQAEPANAWHARMAVVLGHWIKGDPERAWALYGQALSLRLTPGHQDES